MMNQTDGDLESMIVTTTWEDRDTDMVVQALLCEEMGLEPTSELD